MKRASVGTRVGAQVGTRAGKPHGTGHWIQQRLSAVVIVVYTPVFLFTLAIAQPSDYTSWRAFFTHDWMRVATALCFLSLLYHAWIGMRDILMDYVQSNRVRLSLYTVVAVLLLANAAWSIQILWSI